MRKIARNMKKLAVVAAASAVGATQAAMTNDYLTVGNNAVNAFDVGAGYGLTILGFLLGLGAIVTGVKVYRRR